MHDEFHYYSIIPIIFCIYHKTQTARSLRSFFNVFTCSR